MASLSAKYSILPPSLTRFVKLTSRRIAVASSARICSSVSDISGSPSTCVREELEEDEEWRLEDVDDLPPGEEGKVMLSQ